VLRIKFSAGRQFSASKSASSPSAKPLPARLLKKMKKIYDLDEWHFDEEVPEELRTANVKIHLKYIDHKEVIDLAPNERVKTIDKLLQESFANLLNTKLFKTYKPFGSKKQPRGLVTTMLFKDLEHLAEYNFIENIFINSIKGGKKIIKKEPPRFYCIKMTVAIQIEGMENGLQTYEERFVLIKAKSSDEAYEKIEKQRKEYELTYLNSQGQLVRWKIESLDDCFVTEIFNAKDLNHPEGAEVYSILKKRRMTKERFWNGNLD
jgi:hypothetical protein